VTLVSGAGQAIVGIIARSRDGLAAGGVALLSVVEHVGSLLRAGIVSDVREAKNALLDGMKARAASQQADVLLKKTAAFKTVTEAVTLANQGRSTSSAQTARGQKVAGAVNNLRDAVIAYKLLGGQLSVDPENLDLIRALLLHGAMPEALPIEVSASLTVAYESEGPISESRRSAEDAGPPLKE
jgi:hypothetical protein